MKNLLNFMLILFSTIIIGQPSKVSEPTSKVEVEKLPPLKLDDKTEKAIEKETRYIDSIRTLRDKEIAKQDKMIKEKTVQIATIKRLNDNKILTIKGQKKTDKFVNRYAVKSEGKAVYWEEIPRSWIGKQITGLDVIRREYFYENGIKVYRE